MTTNLPSSLKQPSKEDYLIALSGEFPGTYKWPIWLRATVINRYRKLMRPTYSSAVEHAIDNREVEGSNPSASTKLKPRYPRKPIRFKKGDSGKKNSISVFPKQPIYVLNHKGKDRPSRVRKIIFKIKRIVLWMKGNKHNGGQHVDL